MPFENQLTLNFTAMSVRKNAPASSGVYGLSSAQEWILVGHSDNIQGQLLQHLTEDTATNMHPTGFTFELCSPQTRVARQDRLVRELEPVCNRGLRSLFDSGRRDNRTEAPRRSDAFRRRP
jgi:hypothetical protein